MTKVFGKEPVERDGMTEAGMKEEVKKLFTSGNT
jgi:hypothetical protein